MVEPGSPAENGGIQEGMLPINIAGTRFLFGGNIITAADGISLADPETYNIFISGLKIGSKVKRTVFREGHLKKVSLKVTERSILLISRVPGKVVWLTPVLYLAAANVSIFIRIWVCNQNIKLQQSSRGSLYAFCLWA